MQLVLMHHMMMPVMSGLAATEYIMAYCPTPILIVSASFNRGELFRSYDALTAGAVEIMEKPVDGPDPKWEDSLLRTLKIVAKIRVITHPRARLGRCLSTLPPTKPESRPARSLNLVALGASTGRVIFRHLLPNALAPVLVVVAFGIAAAIFVESGLSWLGFGVMPPTPTWGNILRSGWDNLRVAPHLIFPPSVAIFIAVLTFNLIGDALRDVTDPRLTGSA